MKKVAIITRTRDREILLPRAFKSIEGQKFRDFCWVLVNDAGECSSVEKVASMAVALGIDVRVIHRPEAVGMEAASNDGIKASDSEYIAIHDDDDTWHPAFLERMVAFLDKEPIFVGAVCHSEEVEEEIQGKAIYERSRKPMNAEMCDIHISELFLRNLFPPISLLYRREALETIGLYDESLPVLGDWDFNLRLILHGEIAVVGETLAGYHVREDYQHAPNSIHCSASLHNRYNAVIRNRLIRAALTCGALNPGYLMALASFARTNRGHKAAGQIQKKWQFMSRLKELLCKPSKNK